MALNDLAQNLHKLMSDERISSSELARRINIPSDTIKKIRTNKNTNPTLSTLRPIATYFNITISQLIGECDGLSKGGVNDETAVKAGEIPLISWEDALSWPTIKNAIKRFCTSVGHNLSNLAYGIQVENADYKTFEIGTVLFIDPEVKYTNHDYVLAHKSSQKLPTIKKLLQNDNNYYLETIVFGLNSVQPLASDDNILGVIVGYEKWFK